MTAVLLPWDALRVAVIYMTYPFVFLWQRWDPYLHHFLPYLLLFLVWFVLLVVVYMPLGVTVLLAERETVLACSAVPEAWRTGWRLFRANVARCCAAWLQVLAADVIFIVGAWFLAALLPWAFTHLVRAVSADIPRWTAVTAAYLVLAALLLPWQALVQCFKSSLWTATFLELREKGVELQEGEGVRRPVGGHEDGEELFYPPLTGPPVPPPGPVS